jgi:hypothetical protein
MGPLKVLQSVEELIFQIATWIVLLPRTFLRVLRRPQWVPEYVSEELHKDATERFSSQMSPVLFWVLIGLVPHLLTIDLLGSMSESRVASEKEWLRFLASSWEARLLVISIFALSGPLAFSTAIARDRKETVSRDSLRSPFYGQCYAFAPAYLFLVPAVTFTLRYDQGVPGGAVGVGYAASWIAAGIWILFCETNILSVELHTARSAAFRTTVRYLGRTLWFLLLLELLVITAFQGLAVWR